MTQTPAPPADRPTIFVVDDDDSLRRALARLLRTEGWNVETFESARLFLDQPPVEGAGCVLLDVSMPDMTGPQAHAEMLARGLMLPVVFLTAHGDLPTGIEAMKLGAVDFLVKPVKDVALIRALRQALQRDAAQQIERQRRRAVEARLALLTPREHEVLLLVITGLLNKQIADRMSIAIKTVKVHRARVMQKLEADSVAALVHQCEAVGLMPQAPSRRNSGAIATIGPKSHSAISTPSVN